MFFQLIIQAFCFVMAHNARLGHDFKDYICPDTIEKHSNYDALGGRYSVKRCLAKKRKAETVAGICKDQFEEKGNPVQKTAVKLFLCIGLITYFYRIIALLQTCNRTKGHRTVGIKDVSPNKPIQLLSIGDVKSYAQISLQTWFPDLQ